MNDEWFILIRIHTGSAVRDGLRWSEGLDEVFRENYLADPTMSWQYFGSSSGFLRHYPGMMG